MNVLKRNHDILYAVSRENSPKFSSRQSFAKIIIVSKKKKKTIFQNRRKMAKGVPPERKKSSSKLVFVTRTSGRGERGQCFSSDLQLLYRSFVTFAEGNRCLGGGILSFHRGGCGGIGDDSVRPRCFLAIVQITSGHPRIPPSSDW